MAVIVGLLIVLALGLVHAFFPQPLPLKDLQQKLDSGSSLASIYAGVSGDFVPPSDGKVSISGILPAGERSDGLVSGDKVSVRQSSGTNSGNNNYATAAPPSGVTTGTAPPATPAGSQVTGLPPVTGSSSGTGSPPVTVAPPSVTAVNPPLPTQSGDIAGTTTPVSNSIFVPLVPTRSPCSGNATCNPNGGPGLSKQPNIVFFLADDLGHADLSWTEGNLQTPTPNIDKLAWDGIILHRHYSNPICTPTRAALMTGKYTFRIGMQTAAISNGEPWGLPYQFRLMPQYFKDLGYDTWGTGKWHLGEHQRASFPSSRGFDESWMLTSGDGNWFNYTTGWIIPIPLAGRMLRENGKMVFANITNNEFLPEAFTNHAEKWIRNANPNNPFLLYFATTAVHTAFEDFGAVMHTMPQYQLRPPVFSFTDKYPMRKKLLATVQVLDEQFKRITDALTYKGIINNTIIVFFADNGAAIPSSYTFVHGSNHGSNWPLRLGKGALFEGGCRTSSFIWSPLLPKRGRITEQLFHVTDWLPTMYEAAGGDVNQLGFSPGDLSGMSQWRSLYSGLNYGPRTELVHNIDTIGHQYGMIYQDSYGTLYKLLGGNAFGNTFIGWYRTPGTSDADPQTVWTPTAVNCNFPPGVEVSKCVPWVADCLWDLTNDPCELNNIAATYPSMAKLLRDKITAYNATSIPSGIRPAEEASYPMHWDGQWAPWRDCTVLGSTNPADCVGVLDTVPLTFLPFNPSSSY